MPPSQRRGRWGLSAEVVGRLAGYREDVPRVAGVSPVVCVSPAAGRTIVASDLDRTLIYSAAALGLDAEDGTAPDLVVAEVYHGRPLSYLTRLADQVLALVRARAEFVPVTTRTVEQYGRIRFGAARPGYAVAANGARIVVGEVVDEDWSTWVAGLLAGRCAPLEQVVDRLGRFANTGWLIQMRTAEDLFCYAVVDRAAVPPGVLADLSDWCAELGWVVSLQGRKLYCVPRPLRKSAAVAEIHRRIEAGLVIAAGDSWLDADLLKAADVALRPAHGELHGAGMTLPRLIVTDHAGVLGGEEILLRILATLTD